MGPRDPRGRDQGGIAWFRQFQAFGKTLNESLKLRVAKCKRVRWFGKSPAIEIIMDWKSYITADPAIMHGAVCFRGTRIPVSIVLDNLAAGETAASILSEYPTLKAEHIPAAIGYAADVVRERIVAVPV